MVSINVENIVAEVDIDLTKDLEEMAKILPDARYNSEGFPNIVFGVSSANVAYVITEDGRIIFTGAKSIKEIRECIDELSKALKGKGPSIKSRNRARIKLYVLSAEMPTKPDLEKLAAEMDNADYDPNSLPAVVYREKRFTVLIFHTGKVVCICESNKREGERVVRDVVKKIKEVG